jgi:hypothetical protein
MQEQNRKISHKQASQEGLIEQGSENLFGDSNPVSHVGVEFSVDKRLFSFLCYAIHSQMFVKIYLAILLYPKDLCKRKPRQ